MKTKLRHWIRTSLIAASLIGCTTAPSGPPATPGNAKAYPLAVCIVTDNGLDSMGGRVTRSYNGQEIQFCCKPCAKKFEANPAKYLAKLP